jgi:hypothetical protein
MEIDAPEVAAATGAAQHWTDIVASVWPQQFEALFDAAAHEAELIAKWHDMGGRKAHAAEMRRVWAANVQGVRGSVGNRMRALTNVPVDDRRDAALRLAENLDRRGRRLRRQAMLYRSAPAGGAFEGLANAQDVFGVQCDAWATFICEGYSYCGDHHWTDELVVLGDAFEAAYAPVHDDLKAALSAIRLYLPNYHLGAVVSDDDTPVGTLQRIARSMRAITDGDVESRDQEAKAIAQVVADLWFELQDIVRELSPWTAASIDEAVLERGRQVSTRLGHFAKEYVLALYSLIASWLPEGELPALT